MPRPDAPPDRSPADASSDRAEALVRIASTVAETEHLDALLPAVARAAAEAVGADQASVYVYDAQHQRTVAAGHFFADDQLAASLGSPLERLNDLVPDEVPAEAEVIRTGRPLLRDQTTAFPDPIPTIRWRSDVVVPLLVHGEVLGVLYVRELQRERVFNAADLTVLDAIGRQAGLAVLHAREAAAAARRADHLAVLNDTGQALTLSLDEDELCAIVHEQVRRVLPVDAFFVGLVDEAAGVLRCPYLFDAGRRWPPSSVPLDRGPAGRAIRSARPLLIGPWGEPIGTDAQRFGDLTHRAQSALFVPMLRDGRVLGVLSAQRYDSGTYDADDMRTLETLAHQAAAAFSHARLFAESVAARQAAERHAADLEAVLAIARASAAAPDLATMLATLADELGTLLPHDELVVFRPEATSTTRRLVPIIIRHAGPDEPAADWSLALDEGLVGAAFTTGEALLVNDAQTDPRYRSLAVDPPPDRAAGEHVLVAPLVVAGEPLGVIHVSRIGGAPFSEVEFALFRVLTEQTAVAVRNAMLREDAEQARLAQARQTANLEALLAVSRSIASAPDLKTVLAALADELDVLIPHDEIALYRLTDDGRLSAALYRVGGRDVDASSWDLAVGQGVIGDAIARGEAILVNDAHLDPRSVYLGEEERYRNDGEHTMQAPLVVAGQPLGVLHLSRSGPHPFSADEFATFRALAEEAAVAIRNAALLDETRAAQERAARQAANLEAVLAISRAITSAGDVDPMLELLADELAALVPYDVVTVFRVAGDGVSLEPLFFRGKAIPGFDTDPKTWTLKVGEGVIGSVFASGRAERITNIERDPRAVYPFDADYVREHGEHAIIIPVVLGNRPTGVLALSRIGGEPFTADELDVCRALADQVGVVIYNTALVRDVRAAQAQTLRRAGDLEAALAVARSIGQAPDAAAKLEVLAEALASLIPHDGLYVYHLLADGETLQPVFIRDAQPKRLATGADGWRMRVGEGLTGHAAASGRAELVNDAHRDPRSVFPAGEDIWRHRVSHAMTAPLLVDGRVTGVLYIDRVERDPFTEDEFTLLRVLAEHVAVGLQSAALLEETRAAHARAARHVANLEAILATTRTVTARLDLGVTFGALADHLQAILPHDRFTIWRLDERESILHPLYNRFKDERATAPLPAMPRDNLIDRVLVEGRALVRNDDHLRPTSSPEIDPSHGGRPVHKMVAPLILDGRPIGIMVLARYGEDRFSGEDLDLFRVLAGQVEVAIQASHLLEEERRRRRHATALVEVAAALNRATTLDEVVRHLAATAAAAVGADRCSLYVFDEAASRTVAWHHHGYPDASAMREFVTRPPADFPIERELIDSGAPVVGERLRELLAQQRWANPYGQRGGAVLPLRVRGRTQGALYVWSSRDEDPTRPPYDFDADEVALLEAIGDQAGVAIERARLYLESERRVAQLRAIAGVNAAITRTLDREAMLAQIMVVLRATVESDWGIVTIADEAAGGLRIIAAWGPGADGYDGMVVPLDGSINGHVFRTGEPLYGDVETGLPHFAPPGDTRLGRYVLCVPLQTESGTIGTLEALRDEPGPFDQEEFELYQLVAGQIAIGLERARIYEVAVAARERSDRQARTLGLVLDGSLELASQVDLDATLRAVGDGVSHLAAYHSLSILRYDEGSETLRLIYAAGANAPKPTAERIAVGQGLAGQAFARREPLVIAHAEHDPRLNRNVWDGQLQVDQSLATGLHVIAVPLIVEGAALGVLTIHRFGPELGAFSEDEFAAVRLFAGQAAAAIRNAELNAQNRDLYLGGIRALAEAVDQKDQYTRGHSERVSAYARRIADDLGLPQDEAELVELAGLLHDIGKIGVPDRILQKTGKLSEAEYGVMMQHAAHGAAMLVETGAAALQRLVPLVLHHHEWFDGNGYPDRLSGDAIPLGAAIIAVADAFDTMVTDRPYRRQRSVDEALSELRRWSGSQFRADVVAALERVLSAEPGLPARLQRRKQAGASAAVEAESIEERGALAVEPAPSGRERANLVGHPRSLQLMIDLAGMTRHMPDLDTYLDRVVAILRQLDYDDAMLFLVDEPAMSMRLAAHTGDLRELPIGYRLPFGVGAVGSVAQTGEPLSVQGVRAFPGQSARWPAERGAELAVPLVVETELIGVLSVAIKEEAFSKTDEAVLTLFAERVAVAVHVAQLHAAARRAAVTDGLTGLFNHRAFYEELERATVAGAPFSVVLFDVEGLKAANDSGGHLAGDALLRRVADTIRSAMRAGDIVARYGGDEFGALLFNADRSTADAIASRVRAHLLQSSEGIGPLRTTVRYGVAAFPEDGTSPYELVGVADARLYEMRARFAGEREWPIAVTHD